MKNRDGRRFFLGETGLYIERGDAFVPVPYDSITRCDWITDSDDFGAKVSQKRLHDDQLILRDEAGARHELDALGPAFQGMYNYFQWLLARPAHAATIDRLWLEHRRAAFPKRVRGQVVGGVDFVMLDANIAGSVSSFRERGTLLPQQIALLGLAYGNCNRLIPTLHEDAAIYFERLERIAGLVLREIARTEESPGRPPREIQE